LARLHEGRPSEQGLKLALLAAASSNEGETGLSRTIWLIKYNFNRPHQSFDYPAPRVYIEKEVTKIRSPVLPVWTSVERNRAKQKPDDFANRRFV